MAKKETGPKATVEATPELIARVQSLAEKGLESKKIRATLTLEDIDDKLISAAIKAAGIGRSTSGFTQSNTLALLETGVSEFELYRTLIEAKARNELRWIRDRNRIRITLNRVITKLGGKVEEKPATEAQKKQAAEIVGK